MLGPPGVLNLRGLELYAGTGNIGLEMLRRGAHSVHFVERHPKRASAISRSIKSLGFEPKSLVIRSDALAALENLTGVSYDIVFADPPYDTCPFEQIVCALQRLQLLRPDARIILEHSSRLVLPDLLAGAVAVRKRTYGDSAITIYNILADE